MRHITFALMLVLAGGLADAQTPSLGLAPSTIDSRREAIGLERSKLEAGFLLEDAACYKRFAVNGCLADVSTRRREAMSTVRRQEISLNDEERKIKGEQQVRQTQEKSSPQSQQEAAERRTKAAEDYRGRLDREKVKQQERVNIQSNEKTASRAAADKMLVRQQKNQARTSNQAAAAEAAQKLTQRQQQAQVRRAEYEADKLKRVKPLAKPLPLPE